MTPRSLFGRLDDWLNPIVVKELRQAVRSRVVVAALMLFLVLQVAVLAFYVLSTEVGAGRDADIFRAGREVFTILQGILLGTCLLVPAYAGVRLGAERSDTNVDLLFISTLRPRAIVAGKLLSAVVLVLLVFSACAPFMTFTYLLRGLDIPTIALILLLDFLVALWGIQAAIFLAAIPAPAAVRGVFLLAGLAGLIGLFSATLAATRGLLLFGFAIDSTDFLVGLVAAVVLVLAGVGMLFVWSVAVLSPPSANRSLVVRAYAVGYWLATGLALGYLSRHTSDLMPLATWVLLNGLLFSLLLLVAINERDHWGPRVARWIPRRSWLRAPAFLFYSGSAGGVLFAVLLFLLTVGLGLLAKHLNPHWRELQDGAELIKFVLIVGLFAYCYGMSAALVRATLLRHHIKPINTWLVALLLAGLGSVLPYMIAYFFFPETWRYSRPGDLWQTTNPFVAIDEAMSRWHRSADPFDAPCLPFLSAWALVVTGLAVPWFVRQVQRFRPPERPPILVEPVGADAGPAEAALIERPVASENVLTQPMTRS